MFKIEFLFDNGIVKTYGGTTYIMDKEKYAILDESTTKLYASPKIARNCAMKLSRSCVNCHGAQIRICEV